jgi:hypothetical protein
VEIDELHDGGFEGLAQEPHTSLSRRQAPFLRVADFATGRYIRPLVRAALDFGDDVIDGQIS